MALILSDGADANILLLIVDGHFDISVTGVDGALSFPIRSLLSDHATVPRCCQSRTVYNHVFDFFTIDEATYISSITYEASDIC